MSDIRRSAYLLAFQVITFCFDESTRAQRKTQEEPRKLILLGSEPSFMSVIDVEALIEGNALFIVAADSKQNIHVLAYAPYGTLIINMVKV